MRARRDARFLLIIALLFFLSSACALPFVPQLGGGDAGGGSVQVNAQTLAVQTIESMMTQVGGSAITTTAVPDNNQAQATATGLIPTLRPSSTPLPTSTTIVLPKYNIPVCDQGKFVKDVSVPDGSTVTTGQEFTKTWRIRNTGTCTWTEDYSVVFVKGKSLGATTSQKLGQSVLPGEEVDISVKMKAPGDPGSYRGDWKLRNAGGVLFGLGAGSASFFVEIKVISPNTNNDSGYDFTANYCSATWTSNDETLPCIGADGDADGFVLYRSKPQLETGYIDDEPGLITNPPKVTDGWIRGEYPAITVKDGDHFETIIGCEYNAKNCNVRFEFSYEVEGSDMVTFKTWDETYNDHYTTIDVDLSSLAGKKVIFVLTVYANGESNQDRALWLLPRIIKR